MTYIYQADIYCDDCAVEIEERLDAQSNGAELYDSGDSDSYPQFDASSGEADSPQHCGGCGVFLENPLTQDGERYVEEAIVRYIRTQDGDLTVLKLWADFYSISLEHLVEDYFLDTSEVLKAISQAVSQPVSQPEKPTPGYPSPLLRAPQSLICFDVWVSTVETESADAPPWHYQTTQWQNYVSILRRLESGEDERGELVTNVDVQATHYPAPGGDA